MKCNEPHKANSTNTVLFVFFFNFLFVRAFVGSFTRSSVPSFARLFVRSFACSFSDIRSYGVWQFARSFIHSFIGSLVGSFRWLVRWLVSWLVGSLVGSLVRRCWLVLASSNPAYLTRPTYPSVRPCVRLFCYSTQ